MTAGSCWAAYDSARDSLSKVIFSLCHARLIFILNTVIINTYKTKLCNIFLIYVTIFHKSLVNKFEVILIVAELLERIIYTVNLLLFLDDSDLNLVIDKDGFLSATPMHDGDLCDMWAGARASHGVLNGKVYYEVRVTQHYYKRRKTFTYA